MTTLEQSIAMQLYRNLKAFLGAFNLLVHAKWKEHYPGEYNFAEPGLWDLWTIPERMFNVWRGAWALRDVFRAKRMIFATMPTFAKLVDTLASPRDRFRQFASVAAQAPRDDDTTFASRLVDGFKTTDNEYWIAIMRDVLNGEAARYGIASCSEDEHIARQLAHIIETFKAGRLQVEVKWILHEGDESRRMRECATVLALWFDNPRDPLRGGLHVRFMWTTEETNLVSMVFMPYGIGIGSRLWRQIEIRSSSSPFVKSIRFSDEPRVSYDPTYAMRFPKEIWKVNDGILLTTPAVPTPRTISSLRQMSLVRVLTSRWNKLSPKQMCMVLSVMGMLVPHSLLLKRDREDLEFDQPLAKRPRFPLFECGH
jgi:hypothetical protein